MNKLFKIWLAQLVLYVGEEGGGGGDTGTPAPAAPAAPAPAAPAAPPAPPDFMSMIPEEYKGNPALRDIKDVKGLVSSYVNAQSLIGDRVPVPKDWNDEKQVNEFYNKLGRPESGDKYDFGEVKLPAGIEVDKEVDKFARDLFHKAGLTPKQAATIYHAYNEKSLQDYEAYKNQSSATEEAITASLKKEWGTSFEVNLEAAKYAARTIGGDSFVNFLNSSGMGNHPEFIKSFFTISKMMGEDKTFRDNVNNAGFTGGVEQAKAQIATLQSDKDFMNQYTNAADPLHKQALERMTRLWTTAYPGKQQD